MQKQISVLAALLLSPLALGADVVICPSSEGEVYQILDSFEHQAEKGSVKLGDPTLSVSAKVSLGLSRLKHIAPRLMKELEADVKRVSELVFYSAIPVVDLNDTGPTDVPAACRQEQIAVSSADGLPYGKPITIYEAYWKKLDSDQQAILLLGEIIHNRMKRLGDLTSAPSRRLNRLLVGELLSIPQNTYQEIYAYFMSNEIRVSEWWMQFPSPQDVYPPGCVTSFHENGNIARTDCHPGEDAVIYIRTLGFVPLKLTYDQFYYAEFSEANVPMYGNIALQVDALKNYTTKHGVSYEVDPAHMDRFGLYDGGEVSWLPVKGYEFSIFGTPYRRDVLLSFDDNEEVIGASFFSGKGTASDGNDIENMVTRQSFNLRVGATDIRSKERCPIDFTVQELRKTDGVMEPIIVDGAFKADCSLSGTAVGNVFSLKVEAYLPVDSNLDLNRSNVTQDEVTLVYEQVGLRSMEILATHPRTSLRSAKIRCISAPCDGTFSTGMTSSLWSFKTTASQPGMEVVAEFQEGQKTVITTRLRRFSVAGNLSEKVTLTFDEPLRGLLLRGFKGVSYSSLQLHSYSVQEGLEEKEWYTDSDCRFQPEGSALKLVWRSCSFRTRTTFQRDGGSSTSLLGVMAGARVSQLTASDELYFAHDYNMPPELFRSVDGNAVLSKSDFVIDLDQYEKESGAMRECREALLDPALCRKIKKDGWKISFNPATLEVIR